MGDVVRCGICDVCHFETPRISSLEKQTPVTSSVQMHTSSGLH